MSEARRVAARAATVAGLDRVQAGNIALIVTELATNLVKHAGGGSLVIQVGGSAMGARDAVEVLSIDRGPGIRDMQSSLRDGYSTSGTPGTGLGAVGRLSSRFDIYSAPGQGTVVFARVSAAPARQAGGGPGRAVHAVGAGISIAMKGETVCGDAHVLVPREGGCRAFVADGLGHGQFAFEAARQAVEACAAAATREPAMVIQAVHEALLSTRGAAVAVADVDFRTQVVRYCGLGNIVGAVIGSAGVRRMVSQNGTAGQGRPKFTEFAYPVGVGSVVVMHSDGLQARWDPAVYPGAVARHPAILAALLYRDFERGRDDTTVVAVQGLSRS